MTPTVRIPRVLTITALAAAAALGACSRRDAPTTAAATASPAPSAATKPHAADTADGIAWRMAASDGDIDAAFSAAKADGKPVFLYWGAKWCPPCNQVKATLFNRQDFIERSRAFVPVYIDGDTPGAQKIGARFKVTGYPTMVLFSPQGEELTRLPGEVDPGQYSEVLTVGMNAKRPVRAVLADARAGGAALTPNDWKLLAFYSWDTDHGTVVPSTELPAVLGELAAKCPAAPADTAARLALKATAAHAPKDEAAGRADAAALQRLQAVLDDAALARTQTDVLANQATDLVRATTAPKSAERAALVQRFDSALQRLEADASLSRADRLSALIARVDLARIELPKNAAPTLAPALLADVRDTAARLDREITDGYERQAVIPSVAYMLTQAGLGTESDALLEANLAKSHSPYYLMSALASNAKKRGDKAAALKWSEDAFKRAEGPATRLQWGSSHLTNLVELAPTDEARIEATARQLLDEAAAQPNAFYERSARSLQRMGGKLVGWSGNGAHAASLKRLQQHLDGICAKLPEGDEQRRVCEGLLKPAAAPGVRA